MPFIYVTRYGYILQGMTNFGGTWKGRHEVVLAVALLDDNIRLQAQERIEATERAGLTMVGSIVAVDLTAYRTRCGKSGRAAD